MSANAVGGGGEAAGEAAADGGAGGRAAAAVHVSTGNSNTENMSHAGNLGQAGTAGASRRILWDATSDLRTLLEGVTQGLPAAGGFVPAVPAVVKRGGGRHTNGRRQVRAPKSSATPASRVAGRVGLPGLGDGGVATPRHQSSPLPQTSELTRPAEPATPSVPSKAHRKWGPASVVRQIKKIATSTVTPFT
jgi:hypothetical protein